MAEQAEECSCIVSLGKWRKQRNAVTHCLPAEQEEEAEECSHTLSACGRSGGSRGMAEQAEECSCTLSAVKRRKQRNAVTHCLPVDEAEEADKCWNNRTNAVVHCLQ